MPKVMLIAALAESIPYDVDMKYIGVDHGAYLAMKQEIPLLCAIGDFDSTSLDEKEKLSQYTNIVSLPERKDETDSEAAIHYALAQGFNDITLYGCFGGRIDHSMANIYLLMHRSYPLTLMDNDNLMKKLTPGKYTICNNYRHLSLLALEESVISELGVSYPLAERLIHPYDIYTVSNHILQKTAEIIVHSGSIILMQSNGK